MGQLAVHLEVGGQIFGKVDAVAGGPAVAAVPEQIDVRILVQQVELGRQIHVVAFAEILVHPLPYRQGHTGEGHGLQLSAVALDQIKARPEIPLHGLFRVIGVLGPVDEAHRIPGVSLAPLEDLFAQIEGEVRGRLDAGIPFKNIRLVVPGKIVLRAGCLQNPVEGRHPPAHPAVKLQG